MSDGERNMIVQTHGDKKMEKNLYLVELTDKERKKLEKMGFTLDEVEQVDLTEEEMEEMEEMEEET